MVSQLQQEVAEIKSNRRDVDDLVEVESIFIRYKLRNMEDFNKAILEIAALGGRNTYDFIFRATQKIISNKFSSNFSWLGRKGKRVFKDLSLSSLLINAAIKTKGCTIKDAEIAIQKWLRRCNKRAKNENKINSSISELLQRSTSLESLWNFPNCLAAIDGKHVITDKPPNSGSLYFNYKKSFSVILLAFVDAHCRFTAVDVGAYGRSSDGGVFANSTIGKKILSNALDIPEPKTLPGCNLRLPHVFVGDEAFPLHNNLMRPYPGRQCLNNEEVKIYNYRLSRARRVSENAFGILVKRFRIYQRHLQIDPDKLDKVILATCCLHNFLRNDTCHWTEEQHETIVRPEGIENIPGIGGASTTNAMGVRDSFKNYFNSPNGSVSWQTEMVRRGKRNVT
ncbi:hypothetical protein PPYR_05735 [Photinus pyralis]|uniref:DDE Tnp4 domain-containing protein n=1 Tax=Photinus pyralis TaxID=7054 RepID=A0A5N4AVL5_PHOPY|nr:hypothetical protein PPYR_05735 [Photinus pyralis]